MTENSTLPATSQGLRRYGPLFTLVIVSMLAATALWFQQGSNLAGWMHHFMGFFLCMFAMLKLFNLSKFADGFQKYDLLAQRMRMYALAYPFLELALGLGYLSYIWPPKVYVATIILLGFGAIGVIMALRRGLNINCPCMGNVLQVPLSTVTLTEDLGMVFMAAFMLWMW